MNSLIAEKFFISCVFQLSYNSNTLLTLSEKYVLHAFMLAIKQSFYYYVLLISFLSIFFTQHWLAAAAAPLPPSYISHGQIKVA